MISANRIRHGPTCPGYSARWWRPPGDPVPRRAPGCPGITLSHECFRLASARTPRPYARNGAISTKPTPNPSSPSGAQELNRGRSRPSSGDHLQDGKRLALRGRCRTERPCPHRSPRRCAWCPIPKSVVAWRFTRPHRALLLMKSSRRKYPPARVAGAVGSPPGFPCRDASRAQRPPGESSRVTGGMESKCCPPA